MKFKTFLKKIAGFFWGLPYKPESVKQRWIAVFFILAIVFVVIPVWFSSFNSVINPSREDIEANSKEVEIGKTVGPSFFEIMSVGMGRVGQDIIWGWQKVGEGFSWLFTQVYNGIFWLVREVTSIF